MRNEVSFIMGFDVSGGDTAESRSDAKPGEKAVEVERQIEDVRRRRAPVALVDQASFEMLPKGGNLWVKNAAKESALIAEMRKGAKLVVKAASLRGHQSIDTYSLGGFSPGDGPAAERMPGEVTLSAKGASSWTCHAR